jgi:hypothetical protein
MSVKNEIRQYHATRNEKHLLNAARAVHRALETGKGGYDFRTARPYRIAQVDGVEIVDFPTASPRIEESSLYQSLAALVEASGVPVGPTGQTPYAERLWRQLVWNKSALD